MRRELYKCILFLVPNISNIIGSAAVVFETLFRCLVVSCVVTPF